ncbi:hypothetical protein BASA50_002760 [Batrachochytrium salamandrivorans]|uniref:Uncharacterized protein n=1 Tax=Batrachochytrium salamandrivorans TaxID=1357716 RepID=A0ABQ8FKG2_9FUNG|nr:hypothetical protein BASA60_007205 [Batrachochytrium salamandrivorans]KAH6576164.1 hypothetical protein BASA62_001554 [Batrachochytrium salamandrivorans]KAH6597435.1 hypothetical protein BASA61_003150 [Batrachochytrium salamandrivorans]KAH6599829.1 hypothetical protein BASA50_002760 [Batrachochytrium salamandrivorans]KAH9267427.1 hypothetical protein BASA83_009966 [Batrachochytrium salamandrivorans]
MEREADIPLEDSLKDSLLLTPTEAAALLEPFSSCDISDGLHRLGEPDAYGHLADISLVAPHVCSDDGGSTVMDTRICGPAYTIGFVARGSTGTTKEGLEQQKQQEQKQQQEQPKQQHHMDTVPPGSIVVISAPPCAPNAVFGGLMAARCAARGVRAVVVAGRVRDRKELLDLQHHCSLPVFAAGFSTLGAAPFVQVDRVGSSITIHDRSALLRQGSPSPFPQSVMVSTGDMIVADIEGVVRIPLSLVVRVAQICRQLAAIDARCLSDIRSGRSMTDTFAEHRTSREHSSK